jgi:uncharacterized protein YciI
MSDNKFFLCRLLGPRPSFPFDITDAERALMAEHAAYWREHMRQGHVVVFGPVGDPQGPWGLGIVRAPDLDAVQAFTTRDPVIVAKLGFRMEILPMLQAVLPSDL